MRVAPTLLALLLLPLAASPLVHAEEPEPRYRATIACAWGDADLRVLVVPPAYASLYEHDPAIGTLPQAIVLTADDEAALPWDNAYTRAAVEAVAAWEAAMEAYASQRPAAAHLGDLQLQVDVAGPSFTPASNEYDILIVFPPTQDAGGRASQVCSTRTGMDRPSVVVMSTWFVYSYTPNDVYNIVLHEVGHSLGLSHVTDAPGDLMQPAYPYFIGYRTNPRECPSTLNLEMLAHAFAWVGGAPFVPMPPGIALPASQYAFVCP